MKIGKHDLANAPLFIAEIGNNHEGDVQQAIRLVRAAAKSGIPAVKFQTFITERFINSADEARFKQLKRFELRQSDFRELKRIADEEGITFLSTPFDLESADFLSELVPAFKIGSAENTFYPLLERVASFQKPIILSSGLVDISVLDKAISTIFSAQAGAANWADLAVLHCTTSYPTEPRDCNLRAISALQVQYPKLTIGFSDHSMGVSASLYALVLGARIIERHFTLDKNFSDFRDHKLSSTPEEFKYLIEQSNILFEMLGDGVKQPRECEINVESRVRRAICAGRDIREGAVLCLDDLCWTRPLGEGLPPGSESLILGSRAVRDIQQGEVLLREMFQQPLQP